MILSSHVSGWIVAPPEDMRRTLRFGNIRSALQVGVVQNCLA